MTTKLTAKRFRIRRPEFPPVPVEGDKGIFDTADDGFGDGKFPTATPATAPTSAPNATTDSALEEIKREGLTSRQLRMARKLARKHDMPATSDYDAVRLLRAANIDPFKRTSMLDLVTSDGQPVKSDPSRALANVPKDDGSKLPQTIKPVQVPSTAARAETSHVAEIMNIQRDLSRRRRRKSMLMIARLVFFVLLPTLVTGWYYYMVATPLYATKTEFVIQQSQNPSAGGAGGLGGLLQGSPMATSQDSIAVQGYLQSREAMLRLDEEHDFRAHYSAEGIDPIQRLAPDSTLEAAYKLYQRNFQISYDPTEGLIKMEVIATTPEKSVDFAQALIEYAEGQVDHLTQRLREDQMRGAREGFEEAQAKMMESQRAVVDLQEKYKVLSSEVEVTLITTQIGQLETLLSQDRLSLQQMMSNSNPNAARMEPLERRIAALEAEIALLRGKLTESMDGEESLPEVQSALLMAQADVQTRQLMLAQAIQSMETARSEANRQTRYLSLSVKPILPDEASYPRAFESTLVAMLIFAGIYLMISMTAAILREQMSA
ncbi:capsule biosynthesis protein (plasmid) [Pseudorhodobacter turbinis]|uniref:Capsule biosynthesis protein n=1 Tax=Pseudorhodobacter turbinis TaxID=2500533 RepID=A0A4P8EHY5_9RHOB|nr:capsule biosynthesis protein [Pseudorhodobacter turbinis]QCO56751.1 capsule biosynthesis protein [Pseudorhodobacter turbinis]